jgi:hypothetical protein
MQIVQYTFSPSATETILKGVIKNFSLNGLCLIARQPLEDGQEIMVNSIVVPSSKRATVRWQENIGNDTFKVGLEFRR